MDFQRIRDYIINGSGDFLFYKQREFIAPPEKDRINLYNYFIYIAIKKHGFSIHYFLNDTELMKLVPSNFLQFCPNFKKAQSEIEKLKRKLAQINSTRNLDEIFDCNIQSSICTSLIAGEPFHTSFLSQKQPNALDTFYIPCNSEYCYRFAKLIIEKNIKWHVPFELEIMNVANQKNGSDNIVMHVPAKYFARQIRLIHEVANENPDITFGLPHMFAYPFSNYLAIAPNSKMPFTSTCQNLVSYTIDKYGKSTTSASIIGEYIVDMLDKSDLIDDVNYIFPNRTPQTVGARPNLIKLAKQKR